MTTQEVELQVIESVFNVREVLNVFCLETMRRHGIGDFEGGSMIDIQQDGQGNLTQVICRMSPEYSSKELLDAYNASKDECNGPA